MLLIVEVVMLIGGIWTIVTGRVPSFLVGGGKYQVEGLAARLLGFLLVLPLPVAFLGGLLLGLLFEGGAGYATLLELVIVLGVAVSAVVLMRVAGKRVEHVSDVEAVIAKKAQGALMYALFSVTGVGALICCPLAFVYAGQALRLMDEHGVGEQHRGKAKAARIIAGAFTLLWVAAVVCIVSMVLAGSQ
jgi:hypothetical protein